MNIRHLQIFQTVCREGSMTKAAEKLFMTQPAISHVISELEAELGFPLFDRLSRKLYLNEMGRLFLSKTSHMLELYDNLKQTSKELEQQAAVSIGSSITIGNFALPSILTAFEAAFSNTPYRVTIDNAKSVLQRLRQNQIDIGFIEGIIPQESFVKIPFSTYQLDIVCSLQHPFATRDFISLEELKGERLLLREKGSAIRDTFDSALLLQDCAIAPAWTSVNSQALLQAVKMNLGVSILPALATAPELKKGAIASITLDNISLSCTNHIVYHKDKYLSAPLKGLIDAALQTPLNPY